MAEKVQINIGLTTETRDALRQACKERGLSQGELVELALQTFLEPLALPEHLSRLTDQQTQMLGLITDVHTMFLELLAALREGQHPEATPAEQVKETPKIATYAQMYGDLTLTPAPGVDQPPIPPLTERQHPLTRWFVRRDKR